MEQISINNQLDTQKFRIFLHTYIYNNESYLNILLNMIKADTNSAKDTYDPINKKFELKLKKSKKSANDVVLHYQKISHSYYLFFSSDEVIREIKRCIYSYAEEDMKDKYKYILSLIQSGTFNMTLLYNVTQIMNNSIIIFL